MQFWKRLAAAVLAVGMSASLLAGCESKDEEVAVPAESFTLSVCVGAALDTLDPIYAENAGDQTVLTHLYENLMRVSLDEEGKEVLAGGAAKSVDKVKNADGTVTYTFRLRNAKWSDGEDVKAQDFVYAWQRLANPACNSPYAELLSIVCGYEEARTRRNMNLLQVKAKSDELLVVTLNGDYDWFLSQICTATATLPLREDVVQELKELGLQEAEIGLKRLWWEETGRLVTNGPYCATAYHGEDSLTLIENKRYSEDLKPTAEKLVFYFADTAEEAERLYQSGAVDVVWPLTEAGMLAETPEGNRETCTELETYAVLLNTGAELLQDDMIRHALCLAIDRTAVAQLAGPLASPAEGLVPGGVPERPAGDFREKGGAVLDNDPANYSTYCAQARQILSDAGYASSSVLQNLEYLYEETGNNGAVAQALCRQWEQALGISVTPRGVTRTELWAALRTGQYALAGVELDSDINDAEGFLGDWTSRSPDNVVRYQSSAYDTLMKIVSVAKDETARMGCLHDAETLLLNNHAIVPLFTDETGWEVRTALTGVYRDARGWFSFLDTDLILVQTGDVP